MCLARVRFTGKGKNGPADALTEVSYIERTAAGLKIIDLVGVVTELDAEVSSIDFIDSVVTVEERETPRQRISTEGP